MPQQGARGVGAPAQPRPRHQPEKVAEVQFLEHLIQVVEPPLRMLHLFASANLADQIQAAAHVAAVEVAAIAVVARPAARACGTASIAGSRPEPPARPRARRQACPPGVPAALRLPTSPARWRWRSAGTRRESRAAAFAAEAGGRRARKAPRRGVVRCAARLRLSTTGIFKQCNIAVYARGEDHGARLLRAAARSDQPGSRKDWSTPATNGSCNGWESGSGTSRLRRWPLRIWRC